MYLSMSSLFAYFMYAFFNVCYGIIQNSQF